MFSEFPYIIHRFFYSFLWRENENEWELHETHQPGDFVSEGLSEGTAGDVKMKTFPSTKTDVNWCLKIKLFERELLSLENKTPGETQIQEQNQNLFSPSSN